MPSISETILTQQTHPDDSNTQSVTGEKFKGDGYYGRSDGFHTVQYSLLDFSGSINIQATLAIEPTDDDWFTVYSADYIDSTTSKITNFTGNYVWVRAMLSTWTAGTLESMKLNH